MVATERLAVCGAVSENVNVCGFVVLLEFRKLPFSLLGVNATCNGFFGLISDTTRNEAAVAGVTGEAFAIVNSGVSESATLTVMLLAVSFTPYPVAFPGVSNRMDMELS